MSFPVIAMQQRTKNKTPRLAAYAERIQQRPAFQRAKLKSDD